MIYHCGTYIILLWLHIPMSLLASKFVVVLSCLCFSNSLLEVPNERHLESCSGLHTAESRTLNLFVLNFTLSKIERDLSSLLCAAGENSSVIIYPDLKRRAN